MSSDRIWFGPAGAEIIGSTAEGTPVAANIDGAGPMAEVTGLFDAIGFRPLPWQERFSGLHSTPDDTNEPSPTPCTNCDGFEDTPADDCSCWCHPISTESGE